MMEISTAASSNIPANSNHDRGAMEIEDVDMDIDLGADPDIVNLESEAMNIEGYQLNSSRQATAVQPLSDLSADFADTAPNKIHLRGLDDLTTSDIRKFALEHFNLVAPVRIEWIDDTSANLIYETSSDANEALLSFTESFAIPPDQIAPLELRRAKKLSTHPNVELFARQAALTDVKKPHAREASRFYLLNPDKDPRERRRNYDNRRSQRRDDDRRRYPPENEEPEDIAFDVNMYDDNETAAATRRPAARRLRRRSQSSFSSDGGARRTRLKSRSEHDVDLMSARLSRNGDGRLRDRSASPVRARDGDGTLGFDESGTNIHRLQQRSPTPQQRERRGAISYQGNAGKELFEVPINGRSILQSLSPSINGKELFPSKSSPIRSARELFPRTGSPAIHRRTRAFDAADGTADLFADRMLDKSVDTRKSRSLADRISGGPSGLRRNSLSDLSVNQGIESGGFSILGTADGNESPGFSIRGASAANSTARELFPANAETDLFAGKIKGRGGPRRRAEDMYF